VRWPEVDGTALGTGRADVAFTEAAADLEPGDYWVCAIGENAAGMAFGEVLTFTVPEPPARPSSGGGCGCRVLSGHGAGGGVLFLFAALGFLIVRRVRRRL
jgi:hypothetical protein